MRASITVIYWRDIPAQVVAKQGRNRSRIELSPRFQHAIDRAAVRADAVGTDEYLKDWHSEATPCSSEIDREAAQAAEALEDRFPMPVLNEYVKNFGYRHAPASSSQGDQ